MRPNERRAGVRRQRPLLALAVIGLVFSSLPSIKAAEGASAPEPAAKAPPARAGAWVIAVQTNGKASFRICRDGLFSADCRIYGHIAVPIDIARNDHFVVSFGSNRKQITFTVKSMRLMGKGCEIFGTTGDTKPDRLVSQYCLVQPDDL